MVHPHSSLSFLHWDAGCLLIRFGTYVNPAPAPWAPPPHLDLDLARHDTENEQGASATCQKNRSAPSIPHQEPTWLYEMPCPSSKMRRGAPRLRELPPLPFF
jgi:hypothetical protein